MMSPPNKIGEVTLVHYARALRNVTKNKNKYDYYKMLTISVTRPSSS
jgi:hypothetical protein